MTDRRTVILYRRDGCFLCDHARGLLDGLAVELAFAIDELDIETDADLLKQYMFEIPVVALDGEVVARAPIRERALAERLRTLLGAAT